MIHMRSFTLKVEIVNTNVAFVEGIKNSFAWTDLVKTFISISQQSRFRYKTKQLLKAGKPVKLSFEVRCFENGGNDKGTLVGPKRFCLLGTIDEDWPEEASDILYSDEPTAVGETLKCFVGFYDWLKSPCECDFCGMCEKCFIK